MVVGALFVYMYRAVALSCSKVSISWSVTNLFSFGNCVIAQSPLLFIGIARPHSQRPCFIATGRNPVRGVARVCGARGKKQNGAPERYDEQEQKYRRCLCEGASKKSTANGLAELKSPKSAPEDAQGRSRNNRGRQRVP